jgi:hypothetical protein
MPSLGMVMRIRRTWLFVKISSVEGGLLGLFVLAAEVSLFPQETKNGANKSRQSIFKLWPENRNSPAAPERHPKPGRVTLRRIQLLLVIAFIPEPWVKSQFGFDGLSPAREKSSLLATILTPVFLISNIDPFATHFAQFICFSSAEIEHP